MYDHFQEHNPFRTTTWRADRASYLACHQPRPLRVSRTRDDRYVREYRRFLISWEHAPNDQARLLMFADQPALYYAHLWHFHPEGEWRAMLQARILTRQSDQEIAEQYHTLPETVDYYERLFFNVRDRWDSRDWLVKTVLGPSLLRASSGPSGSMTASQREMLYKMLALDGGPLVLETVLSGFPRQSFPTRVDQVQAWLERAFQGCLARKVLMATRIMDVNRYNIAPAIGLWIQSIQQQREAQASGGAQQGEMANNVYEMLMEIPWEVARRSRLDGTLAGQYRLTSVEPRADEMLLLTAGNELPALAAAATASPLAARCGTRPEDLAHLAQQG